MTTDFEPYLIYNTPEANKLKKDNLWQSLNYNLTEHTGNLEFSLAFSFVTMHPMHYRGELRI